MSRVSKRLSGKQWNRNGSRNSTGKDRKPRTPRPKNYTLSKAVGGEWQQNDSDGAKTKSNTTAPLFHSKDFDWIVSEPAIGFTESAKQKMKLHAAASSDIGFCRKRNEDTFLVDSELGLYIVCDGLGGHVAGEIASQKAIEFASEFFARACDQRILPRNHEADFRKVWSNVMAEAIEYCCDKVLAMAQSDPGLEGMATTITALKIIDGHAFVGHLGNSRLYLKSGEVTNQLTTDHNLYTDAATQDPQWLNSITEVSALKLFKRVLTRCVGRNHGMDVDVFNFPLADNDVLLLCTDGLSNYLTDETSLGEAFDGSSPQTIVDTLVDFANSEGGGDNITAIVIRVESDQSEDCQTDPFSHIERTTSTHSWEPQANW